MKKTIEKIKTMVKDNTPKGRKQKAEDKAAQEAREAWEQAAIKELGQLMKGYDSYKELAASRLTAKTAPIEAELKDLQSKYDYFKARWLEKFPNGVPDPAKKGIHPGFLTNPETFYEPYMDDNAKAKKKLYAKIKEKETELRVTRYANRVDFNLGNIAYNLDTANRKVIAHRIFTNILEKINALEKQVNSMYALYQNDGVDGAHDHRWEGLDDVMKAVYRVKSAATQVRIPAPENEKELQLQFMKRWYELQKKWEQEDRAAQEKEELAKVLEG